MNRVLFIATMVAASSCDLFLNEQDLNLNFNCNQDYSLSVSKPPQLIGGILTIQENLEYPDYAIGSGINGTVDVQFLVNKDGQTICHSILNSLGLAFDLAAIEAIKKVQFEPALKDGQPIVSYFALPVTFSDPS